VFLEWGGEKATEIERRLLWIVFFFEERIFFRFFSKFSSSA